MKPDTTSFPVRVFRLSRLAAHLLRGMCIAALIFPFIHQAQRNAHIQRWSAQLLALLSVQLEIFGTPASGASNDKPLMLVANHVSWLDVFAMNSVRAMRFVAKSEVRDWPLIGWLAAQAGTLFIHRARRHHTAQINDAVVSALGAGDIFVVFPEGTTTAGDVVLPFHASLLEPALASHAMLQPVAVRYLNVDDSACHAADYTGDTSLLESMGMLVSQRVIRVQLFFLTPALAVGHRRELARSAQLAIASALRLPALDRHTEKSADLPNATP